MNIIDFEETCTGPFETFSMDTSAVDFDPYLMAIRIEQLELCIEGRPIGMIDAVYVRPLRDRIFYYAASDDGKALVKVDRGQWRDLISAALAEHEDYQTLKDYWDYCSAVESGEELETGDYVRTAPAYV